MRFLGRRDYDLTTDLALARGAGPKLRSYQGVMFVGRRALAARRRSNRRLRAYVEGGGKVASFGSDSFRRRVRVTDDALRDPSRPERTNVFGERTSARAASRRRSSRDRDALELFEGTDGLVGTFDDVRAVRRPGRRRAARDGRGPRARASPRSSATGWARAWSCASACRAGRPRSTTARRKRR